MNQNRTSREAGFTLMEVIVTTGLSLFLLSAGASMFFMVANVGGMLQSKRALVEIRSSILRELYNEAAWTKTQDANSNLACLSNSTSPCTPSEYPMVLMDAHNEAFYDSSGTKGLDQKGAPCDAYPSRECPFRLVLTWKPICQVPQCAKPQIEIQAKLEKSAELPQSLEAMNIKNYSMKIIREVASVSNNIVEISAGGYADHTCVRYANGIVKCWGRNESGELGDGGVSGTYSATPVQVMKAAGVPLTGVVQLALTEYASCARDLNGYVYCWGKNHAGILGRPPFGGSFAYARTVQVAVGADLTDIVDITSGRDRVCAKKSAAAGGSIYCWGDSGRRVDGAVSYDYKKLGYPGNISSTDFYQPEDFRLWNTVGAWDKNSMAFVQPQLFGTGVLPPATSLPSLGPDHTCLLYDDSNANKVYCWGKTHFGNVSGVPAIDYTYPDNGDIGLQITSVAQTTAIPVAAGVKPIALVTEQHVTCALRSDGTVFCYGCDVVGGTGLGYSADAWRNGDVVTGDNSLGAPPVLAGVTQVKAGAEHLCAIANDKVYCWGKNEFGQIGGAGISRGWAEMVPGSGGASPIGVAPGRDHSCALFQGDIVKCWGKNGMGELGNGTTTDSSTAVTVTGL